MKKAGNGFVKNLHYLCLAGVIALGLMTIVATGGGGGGGGDGDPCAGPVPCLTENWGDTYYEFVDQWGDPVVVMSDGDLVAGGGLYYDDQGNPYPIALAGPVIDCRNGELTDGAIDWNWSGTVEPDEWLTSVEGKLNICRETLRVYDLVLEGEPIDDIVATYVESGILSVSRVIQIDRGFPTKLVHELMKRFSIE